MKSLEDYLRENLKNNVIDHSVRAQFESDGRITFYIHPDKVSGDTLDFIVFKNVLFDKFIEKDDKNQK